MRCGVPIKSNSSWEQQSGFNVVTADFNAFVALFCQSPSSQASTVALVNSRNQQDETSDLQTDSSYWAPYHDCAQAQGDLVVPVPTVANSLLCEHGLVIWTAVSSD